MWQKIEDQRKNIISVKRPWVYAEIKLHQAKLGIEGMENAGSDIAFEHEWGRFVDSIEQFFAKFEDEGKKSHKAFQGWIGEYKKIRKEDPLLRYIFQSRHKNQHENYPLTWLPSRVEIGQDFNGWIKSITIDHIDGENIYYVDSISDTKNVNHKPKLTLKDLEAQLPIIINRGIKYEPPIEHLGRPLEDQSPIMVSKKALEFYEKMFSEGKQKFLIK